VFFYTKHSVEKMDALGISKQEVQNTVLKGMKWKQQQSDKWHAQMAGIEVVFMKNEEMFVIITTYLAGREK